MMFRIKEKYITLSGEAPVPGTPLYLIRFSGCNLSCSYCDTPMRDQVTSTPRENELLKDILLHLGNYTFLKVLFTGGEPLAGERQNPLYTLIKNLAGKTECYIETNGSIKISSFPEQTHFVCDWKTPSSGYGKSFEINNLKILRPQYDCIKFVLNKSDFDWVKEKISLIKKVNPRLPLYLSPQWGRLPYKDLAEFILKNRLPVMMSIQLHKMIWPGEKEGIADEKII